MKSKGFTDIRKTEEISREVFLKNVGGEIAKTQT